MPINILIFLVKLKGAFINIEIFKYFRAIYQKGYVPRPVFIKKRKSGYLGYYIGIITKKANKFQALIIALYRRFNTYIYTGCVICYNYLVFGGNGPIGFNKNKINWPFAAYYFFKRYFG